MNNYICPECGSKDGGLETLLDKEINEKSKDPYCGMRWVNPFTPTNVGRLGHSQVFKFKKERKYNYY